jgi:hypothetical protein
MHWVKDRRDRWISGEDDAALATEAAMLDEIERLRAANLHEQHQIGTDPARLRTEVGAADALANTLRALVAEQHDEIERLRHALGEAHMNLAMFYPEGGKPGGPA